MMTAPIRLSAPAFSGRKPRIVPDVCHDPVQAVDRETEQKETWKDYAKENARREGQRMNAQGAQKILRLAQKVFELFHDVSPFDTCHLC